MECSFGYSAGKFFPENHKLIPQSRKKSYLREILNFVKIFLQTPKMLFPQPCWKRINERPNIFVQKMNLWEEINDFQKKLFSENCPMDS